MITYVRHEKGCVSSTIGSAKDAICVYLRDGTKVTVKRGPEVKGRVWLEVEKQASIQIPNMLARVAESGGIEVKQTLSDTEVICRLNDQIERLTAQIRDRDRWIKDQDAEIEDYKAVIAEYERKEAKRKPRK